MSANPLLSIEGLTASVDEKTILHNVNLNVAAGETHVLMGPNGAGKSTDMGMISRLIASDSGCIDFEEKEIKQLKSRELA